MNRASEQEITQKRISEIDTEIVLNDSTRINNFEKGIESQTENRNKDKELVKPTIRRNLLREAAHFEEEVIKALNTTRSPFDANEVLDEISLSNSKNNIIFDAIVITKTRHFIIEIKYIKNSSILLKTVQQVKFMTTTYKEYLRQSKQRVSIMPVIVVPEELKCFPEIGGIPILKFDEKNKKFSNLEEFKQVIEKYKIV